jgi:MurNAc alpha-1-phosphate uridylyltransferase
MTSALQQAPRKAMVLAAGLGTRMRPLTDDRPKPMVAVAGKALIDHVLDRLAEAGVKEAVVNLHYKPAPLEAHLKTRAAPKIILSDERDDLLDTGGGVKKALPLLGSEPFFVLNADTAWTEQSRPALSRLAAAWDGEKMDALLLLAPLARAHGYDGQGDFDMDRAGRLARRLPGQAVPFAFMGAFLAHPRAYEGAPEGAFSNNLVWDSAAARGRLFGLVHNGEWLHVGTPEAIAVAETVLARQMPG